MQDQNLEGGNSNLFDHSSSQRPKFVTAEWKLDDLENLTWSITGLKDQDMLAFSDCMVPK